LHPLYGPLSRVCTRSPGRGVRPEKIQSPKMGGLALTFLGVSRSPGAAQTHKIDDFQQQHVKMFLSSAKESAAGYHVVQPTGQRPMRDPEPPSSGRCGLGLFLPH
jgi:hypothetical protein